MDVQAHTSLTYFIKVLPTYYTEQDTSSIKVSQSFSNLTFNF